MITCGECGLQFVSQQTLNMHCAIVHKTAAAGGRPLAAPVNFDTKMQQVLAADMLTNNLHALQQKSPSTNNNPIAQLAAALVQAQAPPPQLQLPQMNSSNAINQQLLQLLAVSLQQQQVQQQQIQQQQHNSNPLMLLLQAAAASQPISPSMAATNSPYQSTSAQPSPNENLLAHDVKPTIDTRIKSNNAQALSSASVMHRINSAADVKMEDDFEEGMLQIDTSVDDKLELDTPPVSDNVARSTSRAPRRYMSEHEAIEAPADDEDRLRAEEQEADIKRRICSQCGYQGKWVSEMIRHKRVHQSERPYKCRHCNRTSKWKADLIRHVKKVHSIHVVAKYSRSKTFDDDPVVMRQLKEQLGYVNESDHHHDQPHRLPTHPVPSPKVTRSAFPAQAPSHLAPVGSGKTMKGIDKVRQFAYFVIHATTQNTFVAPVGHTFQCAACMYATPDRNDLQAHLLDMHSLPQFGCSACDFAALQRKAAVHHAVSQHKTHDVVVENICLVALADVKSPIIVGGHVPFLPSVVARPFVAASVNRRKRSSFVVGKVGVGPDAKTVKTGKVFYCDKCPFTADDLDVLGAHMGGHSKPRGLINYKCTFCPFYAKKKSVVFEHLRLHTANPEEQYSAVERNLITPAGLPASPVKQIVKSEPLLAPLVGLTPLPPLQSMSSPCSPSTAVGPHEKVDPDAYRHAGYMHTQFMFVRDMRREIEKITMPSTGRSAWQCRHCAHNSRRRVSIRTHEFTHFRRMSNVHKYKCPTCEYKAPSILQMNEHYLSTHATSSVRYSDMHCDECPAVFYSQNDYALHKINHSNALLHARCELCTYRCVDFEHLHRHMLVHDTPSLDEQQLANERAAATVTPPMLLGQSSHVSDVVECIVGLVNSVVDMEKKETKVNHKCDKCNATFKQCSELNAHMKFHGANLPERCAQCDFSVPFAMNLVRHVQAHH